MSGVEAIGLLAGGAQLAFYTLHIATQLSEIYHRVKDTPRRIQQHTHQIKQLASTAQLIEDHSLLQNDNIKAHVNSTLCQAKQISATLEGVKRDYSQGLFIRRYWKTVKGRREKEILATFEGLEKEKTALLLCISLVNTDLLGTIQGSRTYCQDLSAVYTSCSDNKKSDVSLSKHILLSDQMHLWQF